MRNQISSKPITKTTKVTTTVINLRQQFLLSIMFLPQHNFAIRSIFLIVTISTACSLLPSFFATATPLSLKLSSLSSLHHRHLLNETPTPPTLFKSGLLSSPNTLQQQQQQTKIKNYRSFSWDEIHHIMLEMAETHPSFVTLTNLHDLLPYLTPAGRHDDCPSSTSSTSGCPNTYLTISTPNTPYQSLPTILLTSSLSGTERIGPTILLEFTHLLLTAAHCESLPSLPRPPSKHSLSYDKYTSDLHDALTCRKEWTNHLGLSPDDRRWMARLVATRRIIVAPMVNSLGYWRNTPSEDVVDVMGDFPFFSSKCMESLSARMVNEIMRRDLVQLAVLFHPDEERVEYPWRKWRGGIEEDELISPDYYVMRELAMGYTQYANLSSSSDDNAVVSSSNEEGPDDWSYAGSWLHNATNPPCHPSSYGGYPPERTMYSPGMLRALFFRIGTTSTLAGSKNYGTDEQLLSTHPKDEGIVTRHIRGLLMMTDVIEPYASIVSVGGVDVTDDIVPVVTTGKGVSSHQKKRRGCYFRVKKRLMDDDVSFEVDIGWIVGGGFIVNRTGVAVAQWSDLRTMTGDDDEEDDFDPRYNDQLTTAVINNTTQNNNNDNDIIHLTLSQSGYTKWHPSGPYPTPPTNATGLRNTATFTTSINLSRYDVGDSIAVMVYAILDDHWGDVVVDERYDNDGDERVNHIVKPSGGMSPRSHLANVRVNERWKHELNSDDHDDDGNETSSTTDGNTQQKQQQRVVEGQRVWWSLPLTLTIVDESSSMTMDIMEDYKRMPSDEDIADIFKSDPSSSSSLGDEYEIITPATSNDSISTVAATKKWIINIIILISSVLLLVSAVMGGYYYYERKKRMAMLNQAFSMIGRTDEEITNGFGLHHDNQFYINA